LGCAEPTVKRKLDLFREAWSRGIVMDGSEATGPGGRAVRPSQWIDEVCDRFEAAWQLGTSPRIEDYSVEAGLAARPALPGELVALERELRRRRGGRPAVEEYLDRFSAHAGAVCAAFGAPTDRGTTPTARARRQTGRDLLFGVLSLQNNFIGRDDLLAAFAAWVADRGRPLAQILVDRGALDAVRRALLEALVAEQLRQHGGDTEASLAAVSSVREHLERLGDREFQARLAAAASRSAGPGGDAGPTASVTSSSRRAARKSRCGTTRTGTSGRLLSRLVSRPRIQIGSRSARRSARRGNGGAIRRENHV
jgi:hypothetical protein